MLFKRDKFLTYKGDIMNGNYLEILKCGKLSLKPFVIIKGQKRLYSDYSFSSNEKAKTVKLSTFSDGVFKDDLYITYDERQMKCKRVFENLGSENIELCDLGVKLSNISFGGDSSKDYYYHLENPRKFKKMIAYIDTNDEVADGDFDEQAGTNWFNKDDFSDRIGAGPNQTFPAILISNSNSKTGLVHGTLNQNVFFHNYILSKNSDGIVCEIFSSFKCLEAMEVEPGRVLTDEWYMGRCDNADDIEKVFAHYTDALRKKLPKNRGLSDINRDSLVWGSWNDGLFRDVSEELILKEARFLKENFPTVKWIQLDDGYAVYNKSAHGLGVPYEGDEGIDKEKFPEGLRAYADKIRAIGLRPALWIGGWCNAATKIGQEKKEFLVDSNLLDDQVKNSGLLDVSKPEVREYMQKAVKVLVNKYGFDGVKLDFWSYPFETSSGCFPLRKTTKDAYSIKNQSGYEYRRWWLDTIRQTLPGDGYLQTGCAINSGDPFLGEFFTNYRYGIDIGNGNWENVKTCYLLGVSCFANHAGDLFVPNSDSIGLLPGLTETDAMFWINFCLVTHSMVEIAGLLSKAPDDGKMKRLKKAACNPNNGQDVFFVNYDYRNEEKTVPTIMYFNTPHFSTKENSNCMPVRSVGLFNLSDEDVTESFSVKDLGLDGEKYIITDVWTGVQTEVTDRFETTLKPHGSMLLSVNSIDGVQIFDANIRITDAACLGNSITIATDYEMKEAEIALSHNVSQVLFNGEKLSFKTSDNKIIFDLPAKGEIKLILN